MSQKKKKQQLLKPQQSNIVDGRMEENAREDLEQNEENTENDIKNDVELDQNTNKVQIDDKEYMQLMKEPNDGIVIDNPDRSDKSARFASLPDHKLNVAEFRGRVMLLAPELVVPELLRLRKNDLLLSAKACAIELRRLGFSRELIENNIVIKSDNE